MAARRERGRGRAMSASSDRGRRRTDLPCLEALILLVSVDRELLRSLRPPRSLKPRTVRNCVRLRATRQSVSQMNVNNARYRT